MKNKITTISFVSFIFLFLILNIFIKDNDISNEERRKLAKFPEITISNILNGEFNEDFEKYTLDQFPFRNGFRSIKANYNYYILQKLDNNDIYIDNDKIFKVEYKTDTKSINNFINNINNIISKTSSENKIYSLIIPDKNYYLDNKLFLKIDYDTIYNEINKLNNTTNIDIRDTLNINDYYNTDTHWKQENLKKVIKVLDNYMNFNYKDIDYKINIYDKFYGVYYSQAALKKKPDTLKYLTNEILDNATVDYLENKGLNKIYNTNKLTTFDSYEVFLDGASSFITITNNDYNENELNNKELIVFRDSFGSSLIPLLVPYYSKITVIDIRYITSKNYLNMIEFNNQDILFLYNTLIVNNSFTLKN